MQSLPLPPKKSIHTHTHIMYAYRRKFSRTYVSTKHFQIYTNSLAPPSSTTVRFTMLGWYCWWNQIIIQTVLHAHLNSQIYCIQIDFHIPTLFVFDFDEIIAHSCNKLRFNALLQNSLTLYMCLHYIYTRIQLYFLFINKNRVGKSNNYK